MEAHSESPKACGSDRDAELPAHANTERCKNCTPAKTLEQRIANCAIAFPDQNQACNVLLLPKLTCHMLPLEHEHQAKPCLKTGHINLSRGPPIYVSHLPSAVHEAAIAFQPS